MKKVVRMKPNQTPEQRQRTRSRQLRVAQQQLRVQRRAEGWKRASVWLSPESQQRLVEAMGDTGKTQEQVINDLIAKV